MKHINKNLIIMITILITATMMIIPTNTVLGATADITLDNFESYLVGQDSGSNSYITWTNGSFPDNRFCIVNEWSHSGDKSLKLTESGQNTYVGWINITNNYSYIGRYSMYMKIHPSYDGQAGALTKWYWYFYNSSTLIHKILFEYEGGYNMKIYYYDVFNTKKTIKNLGTYGSSPFYGWFNMTHLGGNNFNYSFNDSGVTDTCRYDNNYTTFNKIKIEYTYQGSPVNQLDLYIDDITINTNTFYSGEYASLSEYDLYCSGGTNTGIYIQYPYHKYLETKSFNKFTGVINGLELLVSDDQLNQVSSVMNDYHLYINSIYCGSPSFYKPAGYDYALVWTGFNITVDNEYLVFEFSCDKYVQYATRFYWYGVGATLSTTFTTRTHNTDGIFGNGVLDGSTEYSNYDPVVCFYYESSPSGETYPDLPPDTLQDYKTAYGNPSFNDSFIEFYGREINCFYLVGDHPIIIYYLTSDYFFENNIYVYKIIHIPTNKTVYFGQISFDGDNDSGVFTLTGFSFENSGEYRIILYNTSDWGNVLENIVFSSRIVTVCGKTDDGLSANPIFPTIGQPLGSIVGMIITLLCLFAPFLLASGLHMKQVIHPVIFAFSGGVGIAISVVLGLFPSWIPFFLVAVGVIVIVLSYLVNKRGGGE